MISMVELAGYLKLYWQTVIYILDITNLFLFFALVWSLLCFLLFANVYDRVDFLRIYFQLEPPIHSLQRKYQILN